MPKPDSTAAKRQELLLSEPDSTAVKIQELRLSGVPRGERARVVHSQRKRLFLALAAGCRERGYEAVSVDEVTARAQLSKATLYQQFDGKDEILAAAVEELTGIAVAAARRGFEGLTTWEELLEAAMRALCESAVAEPELARLSFVEGPVILEVQLAAAGDPADRGEAPAKSGEGTARPDEDQATSGVTRLPSPFGELFAAVAEVAELPDLPDDLTGVALAGGLQAPLANRLLAGSREEILELAPDLADFAIATLGGRRRSGAA